MAHSNLISEEERKQLKNLCEVLSELIGLRPNIPMHQVIVMLTVALNEGKSLKKYSELTDFPPSTISRTFLDCGPKMRSGEAGLGLLEARPSAHSLREHETYLSDEGVKLMKSIAKKLSKR